MCERTKDGYKLSSGRLVGKDFHDFQILTPQEFQELSDESASLIDVITIKTDVSKILIGIENIKKSHNVIIDELSQHTNNCPIQKDVIDDMIDSRIINMKQGFSPTGEDGLLLDLRIRNVWWEDFKNRIISGSKLVKALIIFFTLLLVFLLGTIMINNITEFISNWKK